MKVCKETVVLRRVKKLTFRALALCSLHRKEVCLNVQTNNAKDISENTNRVHVCACLEDEPLPQVSKRFAASEEVAH